MAYYDVIYWGIALGIILAATWILFFDTDGDLTCDHCGCKIGLGEHEPLDGWKLADGAVVCEGCRMKALKDGIA